MQLGLHTFGDVYEESGRPVPQDEVIRNIVEEGKLADRLGLDFFGVGEHHRPDYAVSAPEVVLAGLATVTERISLGTAVTVLGSDDPVRVYQRLATVEALAPGRVEAVMGRGSFIESFPLFGLSLSQYEELFEEKLDLFVALRQETSVTWTGRTRPALTDADVYPRTGRPPLPTWVGVGGTPQSVIRAARHGLPLMLAVIGGQPRHFSGLAALHREALERFGHAPQPIAIHSPGFVDETDARARERFFPFWHRQVAKIGRERGWPPPTREAFEAGCDPDGALFVGSSETVAAKIIATGELLGLSRFDYKYSHGVLPHALMMESIERYATDVASVVRAATRD